jgi:hypothetical protein
VSRTWRERSRDRPILFSVRAGAIIAFGLHVLSRGASPARFRLRQGFGGRAEAPSARRRAVHVAHSLSLARVAGRFTEPVSYEIASGPTLSFLRRRMAGERARSAAAAAPPRRETACASCPSAPAPTKGCVCATCARRAGAPAGRLGHADHMGGSRRDESARAVSGCATSRRAPHRVGPRPRSPAIPALAMLAPIAAYQLGPDRADRTHSRIVWPAVLARGADSPPPLWVGDARGRSV